LSPIVFGTALVSFGKDANVLMTMIFSYQNGFFWDTILKRHEDGLDRIQSEGEIDTA